MSDKEFDIEKATDIAVCLVDVRDDTPLDELPLKLSDLKTLAEVYLAYRLPSGPPKV